MLAVTSWVKKLVSQEGLDHAQRIYTVMDAAGLDLAAGCREGSDLALMLLKC